MRSPRRDAEFLRWRLLAFYSWDTDHEQSAAKGEVRATLAMLPLPRGGAGSAASGVA